MTAAACGASVCLRSETGRVRLGQVAADLTPTDVSDVLSDETGHYLFAVYDRKDRVHAVSWDSKNGHLSWPEATPGDWPVRLYLVRSPHSDFGVMTVIPRQGVNNSEGKNFLPTEIEAASVTR